MKKLVMKKTASILGEYMNALLACFIVSIIVLVIGGILAMFGKYCLMLAGIGFIGAIFSLMLIIGLAKITDAVVEDMEIHMEEEEET